MSPGRKLASLVAAAALAACGGGGESAGAETRAVAAGYRVVTPGPLLGRFPAGPRDVRADTFIESAFTMAVDERSVSVLDVMASRALRLDLEGRLLSILGRPGEGPGELASPLSLEVGPSGDVWVAEPAAGRLSRFRPDGAYAGGAPMPHPTPNFTVLPDGRILIPTMSARSLLGTVDEDGDFAPLAVDPREVPTGLSGGPMDRIGIRGFLMSWWGPDTLLVFRNRHGTDFAAWRAALSRGRDSILSIRSLPLPRWLYTLIEEEVELLHRQLPEDVATGDFFVPFKSVRTVDGTTWLAPAPSGRLIALSLARSPADSATVVVPRGGETEGMLDAAVVGDRLVALYEDQVRIYALERAEADRFVPPE